MSGTASPVELEKKLQNTVQRLGNTLCYITLILTMIGVAALTVLFLSVIQEMLELISILVLTCIAGIVLMTWVFRLVKKFEQTIERLTLIRTL